MAEPECTCWPTANDPYCPVELVKERDEARHLLIEFTEHRAESSIAWMDEWSRRVEKLVENVKRGLRR